MADHLTAIELEWDGKKHKIKVFVDSSGKFTAEFNDEEFSASSLKDLEEKLKREVRGMKEEKSIPCSLIDMEPAEPSKYSFRTDPYHRGRGVVHAIYRGKHERTHAYLFTDLNGRKFSEGGYGGLHGLTRRLTDKQVEEYKKLTADVASAEKALAAWKKKVEITPGALEKKED